MAKKVSKPVKSNIKRKMKKPSTGSGKKTKAEKKVKTGKEPTVYNQEETSIKVRKQRQV